MGHAVWKAWWNTIQTFLMKPPFANTRNISNSCCKEWFRIPLVVFTTMHLWIKQNWTCSLRTGTPQPSPTLPNVPFKLFQEQAELHPQAPAYIVTGEDGEDQALSYGQLNRQANRLSFRLRQLGVRRGHPVAVFADQSFQMLTAITAILKAGGFYVPLDPGYPADRLLWMLADSGARILLKQSNLDLETPNLTILDPDLEDLGEFPDHNPDTVNDGDDIAYVIYTSGSTGRPKGCHDSPSRGGPSGSQHELRLH